MALKEDNWTAENIEKTWEQVFLGDPSDAKKVLFALSTIAYYGKQRLQ